MKKSEYLLWIGLILAVEGCGILSKSSSMPPPPPLSEALNAEDAVAKPDADRGDDSAAGVDGKALYAEICAPCHSPLAETKVARASLDALKNAIANVPSMQGLGDLTDEELKAIADTLGKINPGRGKIKN